MVVANQVVFFTVPDCPLCDEVRQWLKDNRVKFIERDVAGDFGSLREMYKLTGQSLVPVVSFKSKAVVRPDVGLLTNLLL
ncbi:MAG: glutaredoxin 3 [Blastocatellia bacterium]|nr:glutaredoxin 3 [Blastocatellia bacterium]